MKAVILKGIAGFYKVYAEDGNIYQCKARGKFRKKGLVPLAGDRCEITLEPDQVDAEFDGTVDEIFDRTNAFDRPPAANVQTMVVVVAAKDPEPSFLLLDKFTVSAEVQNTELIICLNKADLADEELLEKFRSIYSPIYKFFPISVKSYNEGRIGESGIEPLKEALKGKQVALAGPSGVGKSSLTNVLLGESVSEVGDISRKSLRGKNTTRHTELFKADGFYLFDTPGFSSFDGEETEEEHLAEYFPEMRACIGKCYYNDCRHLKEPDCAVRTAVKEGRISRSRYSSYKAMIEEIRKNRRY